MDEYGDRLKQALLWAAKDAQALRRHLCITYQAVAKVLDGKTAEFSATNHLKACKYLGIDPRWLAFGEGQPAPAVWPFEHVTPKQYFREVPDQIRAAAEAVLLSALRDAPSGGASDPMPGTGTHS